MHGALTPERAERGAQPSAIAASPWRRHFTRPRHASRPHSPQALASAAHAAVTALPRRDPLSSAIRTVTRAQLWIALGAAALAGTAAAMAPQAALLALHFAVIAGAATLIAFRLACLFTRICDQEPPAWRGELPIYTIILPVYREAGVLPALVEAIGALDYPRDRLDVKIVVEADDIATRAVAEALAIDGDVEVIAAPQGEPRTKPRALNIALAFARGDFVTVYDAEDRPHPDQLRAALASFAHGGPELACLQAPLGWYNANENWLTRQFAVEYAAQFHVVLPALARWGWALPLGGTSNHFRVSALRAVGGWDPYNVTEDADLGFRLATNGYRSGVIAPPTLEEATTTLAAWTKQRSRWVKGFLQTWLVHMRAPARLARGGGAGAFAALHLTVGLSALSSLLHAPLIGLAAATGIYGVVNGGMAAPAWAGFGLLAAGYAVSAACGAVGLARAGARHLAGQTAFMPLYWLLHSPAALRAWSELATRPHYWAKTRHGVSRLRAPDADASSQSQQHPARRRHNRNIAN